MKTSVNLEKLCMFLLNEIVDLKTDLKLHQMFFENLLEVSEPKNYRKVLHDYKSSSSSARNQLRNVQAQDFYARLQGESNEFGDFLKDLLS